LTILSDLSIFLIRIFEAEMRQDGIRKKKTFRHYSVVVVPEREGGKTLTFKTSRLMIAALLLLGFAASVAITLAMLVYTPLALYVPIPNPGLEERYGRQIVDSQRRLNQLAEDVVLLKDYNNQLRKALGEGVQRDTSDSRAFSRAESTTPQHLTEEQRNDAYEAGEVLDETGEIQTSPASGSYAAVVTASGPSRASFPLLAPVDGYISQGFDPSHNHFGIDIAGARGTPIHAPGDGVVVFAGWTYENGNFMIIAHGGGYLTVYKHNQALLKSTLSGVRRGETIATLGMSGETSHGPHLHFEVWKNGVPQDPRDYLLFPSRPQ
jgi:murein DD-endopeptidase MepM/ murein hydrolase activator NlpD